MMRKWIAAAVAAACLWLFSAPALGEAKLVVKGPADAEWFAALAEAYHLAAPDVVVDDQVLAGAMDEPSLKGALAGKSADLVILPAHEPGLSLWNGGHLLDCKDMPEVEANYQAGVRSAWSSPEGNLFAVPMVGAVCVAFFNADEFRAQGLNPPVTWAEFMALCDRLASGGIEPLANAASDANEVFDSLFMAVLTNELGRPAERERFRSGELPMNRASIASALSGMAQVGKYLNQAEAHGRGMERFARGECAMYVGSSAEMDALADAPFEWDMFVIPARASGDTTVCVLPEWGIAINPAGANVSQAADFLAWLAGPDGADAVAKALPAGHFPLIDAPVVLDHPHANALRAWIDGRELDTPFIWPGAATYDAMRDGVMKVANGEEAAQAAADGLASAFVPW